MADISPVYRAAAEFGRFGFDCPAAGAFFGFFQGLDGAFQLGVLGKLKILLSLEIGKPGGKIPALHLDVCPVDGEDVVNAAVQKLPVVGDQNEALLPFQVGRNQRPGLGIQMVGWLVNQQEVPRIQEQRRQQHLGLLPVGEGVKGPVQNILADMEPGQLPQQLPGLGLGADIQQNVPGVPLRAGDRVREIVKLNTGADASLVVVFPQQKVQKGGFSPAISPNKAQLPVGIDLKADILEYGIEAGWIGKGEIFNLN